MGANCSRRPSSERPRSSLVHLLGSARGQRWQRVVAATEPVSARGVTTTGGQPFTVRIALLTRRRCDSSHGLRGGGGSLCHWLTDTSRSGTPQLTRTPRVSL